jgi:GPH family glycoside/pentoside/hexuronide:cation symporter
MPSMIYDVCEVEQLNSGSKHSASVISLQALAESLASALGLQILGLVLQLHGFKPEAMVQSEDALLGVMNSFTLYPGILMLLVALIILKYPVNRETFNRVISALEHRKKGMEVDLNQFKDIL